MFLLIVYVLVALVFSFLCSIAEAVLLSVTTAYAALLENDGRRAGRLLRELKDDVGRPLAAILTLNTVAHTVGAAGAGAQAAIVFGDAAIGIFSGVLTLLILVLSEIIPKSLGATYWRQLAPATAYGLRLLIFALYPFVVLSNALTRLIGTGEEAGGMSRDEVAALAHVGISEGELKDRESVILKNLFRLSDSHVRDAMTPRTVVFRVPDDMTVAAYHEEHGEMRFSRIPLYKDEDPDHIKGFVLRTDLLLAQALGNGEDLLREHSRPLVALPLNLPLLDAFERFLEERIHIALLVDEYGTMAGILTLEDMLETLIGIEIVDEGDTAHDMQVLARRLWEQRARAMGIDPDAPAG
jgi:CBS domain containing-hemolysin-like protein